jgi:hypothetical protein
VWSSPTVQPGRPSRPATIHEASFSYCMPESYASLRAWDSSTLPIQPVNGGISQTFTVQQEFYPSSSMAERKLEPSSKEKSMI